MGIVDCLCDYQVTWRFACAVRRKAGRAFALCQYQPKLSRPSTPCRSDASTWQLDDAATCPSTSSQSNVRQRLRQPSLHVRLPSSQSPDPTLFPSGPSLNATVERVGALDVEMSALSSASDSVLSRAESASEASDASSRRPKRSFREWEAAQQRRMQVMA